MSEINFDCIRCRVTDEKKLFPTSIWRNYNREYHDSAIKIGIFAVAWSCGRVNSPLSERRKLIVSLISSEKSLNVFSRS